LLRRQGRLTEAEELLRGVAEIRPSLAEVWFELGKVSELKGEYERAIESFDRGERLRPWDSAFAHSKAFCRAKRLARDGRHPEAIAQYRLAIELSPGEWRAHFELGGELDAANQLEEAAQAFGRAARLNPGFSRAHYNHGVVLAKLGRFRDAEQAFEEALRSEPGYVNARQALAQLRAMMEPAP
jgi:tetratricopeptide (TPR) repeat protein